MTTTLDSLRLHPCETVLAHGRAFHLESGGKGLNLRCTSGRLWITQAGDAADYLLNAGQQLRFHSPRRIVVEALTSRAVLRQENRPEEKS